MSSPFLSGGSDFTELQDGTTPIFASSLGAINFTPGQLVTVDADQNLITQDIQVLTNPLSETLSCENVITAYNTTPVNLNSFIASTLTDISSLESTTQYISASLGNTNISSNISTNDINANNYKSQSGATFIDMSDPSDINVSATDFLFNGNSILTTAGNFVSGPTSSVNNNLCSFNGLTGHIVKDSGILTNKVFLNDGSSSMLGSFNMNDQNIINVNDIIPDLPIGANLGTSLLPFDTINLSGNVSGPIYSRSVDSIVSNPSLVGATGNIPVFIGGSGGVKIIDSGLNSLSFTGTTGSTGQQGIQGIKGDTGIQGIQGLQGNTGQQGIQGTKGDTGSPGLQGLQGPTGTFVNPATANINMGGFEIQNVSAIRNTGSSVIYGNGASTVDIQNVVVGNNALVDSGNINNIVIGSGSYATGGGASVSIGTGASCLLTGGVAIGESAISSGNNSVALGRLASTSASQAVTIGFNIGNSTANSVLFGNAIASIVNIRPNTSGTCDLGTTANRFKDAYISNVISPTVTKSVDDLFLKTGTVAMTGSPNMGQNNIIGANYIQCGLLGGNVIYGSGTTITTPPGGNNIRNVYLGYNNDATGFAIQAIGNECHQTVGAGAVNMIGSTLNVAGANCGAYGDNISITGNNSVAIGSANTISASNAYIIGSSATNNTANSLLVGTSSIANIRPNSNATCNLGVLTTNEFLTEFVRNIDTSSSLSIAPTSATSVAIGRSGVNTTINGTTLATVPYGAWYCTASFNIAFTAGVTRLIPPVASSNGPQVDFSFASGVLTYTGPRTNRVFQINYNINYNLGPSGATMTFFNSKNGNLVLSAVQARVVMATNASYNNIRATCVLTDNVVLSTGDTVQLAASCATLNTITFDFNSCNITGLLN